jgi:Double-stranded DNA deaminase toxin A
VPAWVRGLADKLDPLGPGVKAAGIATTPDGTPLTDAPITNGSAYQVVDSARTLRTDLRPFGFPGNVALSHVEGHVAAIMREPNAPREVGLVMSRPPCGGKFGCDVSLPKLLPIGSTLTVYVCQPDGSVTYHATYRGDGSGVKQ